MVELVSGHQSQERRADAGTPSLDGAFAAATPGSTTGDGHDGQADEEAKSDQGSRQQTRSASPSHSCEQRLHSARQFPGAEQFGHVVIRAGFEPGLHVGLLAPGP